MKINGNVVNPDTLNDVPVKIILRNDGTGQVWVEDFGHLEDGSPINCIWRTDQSKFYIQLAGEDEAELDYTLESNILTLIILDDNPSDSEEMVFTKQ